MSDTHQPQSPDTDDTSSQASRSEMVSELQELGRQLESTFRAFVAGPGQTIRREIGESLQELGSQVQRAVGAIQERPEAADLEQKARNVANQVRESSVVAEVQETLVSGLQQLNQQLKRLSERLEQQSSAPADQADHAPVTQRLTIETETPSSDIPTTKLDDHDPGRLI